MTLITYVNKIEVNRSFYLYFYYFIIYLILNM